MKIAFFFRSIFSLYNFIPSSQASTLCNINTNLLSLSFFLAGFVCNLWPAVPNSLCCNKSDRRLWDYACFMGQSKGLQRLDTLCQTHPLRASLYLSISLPHSKVGVNERDTTRYKQAPSPLLELRSYLVQQTNSFAKHGSVGRSRKECFGAVRYREEEIKNTAMTFLDIPWNTSSYSYCLR